jgi:hypothetical protein
MSPNRSLFGELHSHRYTELIRMHYEQIGRRNENQILQPLEAVAAVQSNDPSKSNWLK